jgi:hypothetical protein
MVWYSVCMMVLASINISRQIGGFEPFSVIRSRTTVAVRDAGGIAIPSR